MEHVIPVVKREENAYVKQFHTFFDPKITIIFGIPLEKTPYLLFIWMLIETGFAYRNVMLYYEEIEKFLDKKRAGQVTIEDKPAA